MSNAPLGPVLRYLGRLAGAGEGRTLTDGQLLQRFIARRDEAAFAALVKRHGPMVLGICRHVLHHHQDAEDAFQATFLVLVRHAASVRKHEALAGWLHGVAYRTALSARRAAVRRRTHEARARPVSPTDPSVDLAWREVQAALDEEVARLPEKFRAAFVLCHQEGRSRAETARLLAVREGTVSSRLDQARKRLQERLARRGISLGTVLGAVALAGGAQAAVPGPLFQTTVRAAFGYATAPGAAEVSANVAALAHGVSRNLLLSKLKLAWVLVLAVGLAGAGAVSPRFLAVSHRPEAPPSDRAEARTDTRGPRTDQYGDALPAGALARLGTVRLRHGGETLCSAFTRDGKTLLTSDALGLVVCWDVRTGRPVRRLQVARDRVHALAVSPDGKTLAVGAGDEISLWDLATCTQVRQGPVTNGGGKSVGVMGIAFAPDGRTLAVRDRGRTAYLWDVPTARVVHRLEGHRGGLTSVAFSLDGSLVATGAWEDPVVRLWDPATGKELRQIQAHQRDVLSVAFSPDGKELATSGNLDPVRFWDPATGRRLREAEAHSANQLCYYPDGTKLAGISGLQPVVWDAAGGKVLFRGEGEPRNMQHLAVAPDGKTLATSWSGHTLDLWDAATGQLRHHLQGHREAVSALGFTADGRSLYSAAELSSVLLWDPAAGKERQQTRGATNALTLSADGRFLVAPTAAVPPPGPLSPEIKDDVGFWDAATGKEVRRFKAGTGSINCVSLSADGKTLAAGSFEGKVIRAWNAESGGQRLQIALSQNWPCPVVLAPDGKTVAAGGFGDGAVRLWDTATGKERRLVMTPPHHLPVDTIAFSPDGRSLATGGSELACLWDVAAGKLLRRFDLPGGWTRALAFSPDGRTLAVAGSDHTVRLWEVATGHNRASFTGHAGPMRAVCFSPDGARLATGSEDTTILVWDVAGWGPAGPGPETTLSPRTLDVLWDDIGGRDAARAHHAVWALVAAPRQAVPFLTRHLNLRAETPAPDQQRVARLLADLDSDEFTTRQRAASELEKLGPAIAPTLRKALAGRPSLEARRRLEMLLERLAERQEAEWVRTVRALEALEHIGDAGTRRLLRQLAGTAGPRMAREAKAALERLARRPRYGPGEKEAP
jgi:RNA polymerase sigma factor (sigma-70 family)